MITKSIRRFLPKEAASGILLVVAAVLALIFANSPRSPYYDKLLSITGELGIDSF